jgi:vacuolar-type H+-ATPase subunit I/STV1
MPLESIESKVERLEHRVNAIELLPARIEHLGVQILQLREEMSVEFSAVRREVSAGDEETRRTLRDEIRAGDERVTAALTARIEDARRETRVLHEDVVGRIAVIGEGFDTLSQRLDRTDAKLDLILARLDTPGRNPKRTRSNKKP